MKKFTFLLIWFGLLSFGAVAQFSSVTSLSSVSVNTDTKDKPQSKVWTYDGRFWTVLTTSSGTFVYRLDGPTWKSVLKLTSSDYGRADCKMAGNVTHILMYRGTSSFLYSIEYVPGSATYKPWTRRTAKASVSLDSGVETATIDIDGTGRMWLASDGSSKINVRYSDSPYSSWSSPITLASSVKDDDICAIIAMPALRKIGVLWSNQATKRFGFRTHADGTSPATWTADEVPASQSALNVGGGLGDDHLNMKVSSNGTLYCAVKTSYDNTSYPRIALLVRRPAGTWDRLYEVNRQLGTRPIVLLNEAAGKLKVIYTSSESNGDILYKESSLSNIAFSRQFTLISGSYNFATSTKNPYTGQTVVLASNSSRVLGILGKDTGATLANSETELTAYPSPFSASATIRYKLPESGQYSITLHDNQGNPNKVLKQGHAEANEEGTVALENTNLPHGLYILRLQTLTGAATLRLVHKP